jgi:2-iminobutanoate/2-iminopropanoate deaminase
VNNPSNPALTRPGADGGGAGDTPVKSRRYIQLSEQGPFSDGVLLGSTLYLAGRIGLDASGKRVPSDIEIEAHNVMRSVQEVLEKVGMGMDDLVYVQVFCSDVSLWERFNRIYCSYFQRKPLPARAFVGCSELLFDAHFEVQGIAVKEV